MVISDYIGRKKMCGGKNLKDEKKIYREKENEEHKKKKKKKVSEGNSK